MPTWDTKQKKIRILVADNNKLLRDKVVGLLADGYDVVATSSDGAATLEMIQLLSPDVAVLGISMRTMTGLEVAAELTSRGSATKVVILTVYDDSDYMRAALKTGAFGYVVKSHVATDLSAAIDVAVSGRHFVSPSCVMSSVPKRVSPLRTGRA